MSHVVRQIATNVATGKMKRPFKKESENAEPDTQKADLAWTQS